MVVRNLILFGLLLGVNIPKIFNENILEEQLQYERVKAAIDENESNWKDACNEKGLEYPPKHLYIRAFKSEKVLEIWARNDTNSEFKLLREYPVCVLSGDIGPKRKEGDKQVPEGLYWVELFNPVSKFHLSIKINYPNKADKVLGHKLNPGSNIFIHGGCSSIGCLPMTDKVMEELYTIALHNFSESGRIPVHIFPAKMDQEMYDEIKNTHKEHQSFWSTLKPIHDYFEENHQLPNVSINSDGTYLVES